MALTDKQKRFCEEYVIDWNATRSAIAAGYSEKTAYSIGSENLTKDYIRSYINKLKPDKLFSIHRMESDIRKDNGHIYIIKCAGFRYYKIGKTKRRVEQRLSALQTGMPMDLSIIEYWYFEQHSEIEKKIHQKYHNFLIRGEWFAFNDLVLLDVIEFISSMEFIAVSKQTKMAI